MYHQVIHRKHGAKMNKERIRAEALYFKYGGDINIGMTHALA
jgi:hypothetical protein